MASAKPTYHRENLKEELLAAAVIYIAEHGHQDLSVRKLSQIVGVSPGAPYHHFPDRRSLLIASSSTTTTTCRAAPSPP